MIKCRIDSYEKKGPLAYISGTLPVRRPIRRSVPRQKKKGEYRKEVPFGGKTFPPNGLKKKGKD